MEGKSLETMEERGVGVRVDHSSDEESDIFTVVVLLLRV